MSDQDKDQAEEQVFSVYRSSQQATKVVTPTGGTLSFTQFRYVTKDADDSAFLDNMIAKGCPTITKGEDMTTAELDPMLALRRKHIAEYIAEQEAKTVKLPDFSPVSDGKAAPKKNIGATTTTTLAALAASATK